MQIESQWIILKTRVTDWEIIILTLLNEIH